MKIKTDEAIFNRFGELGEKIQLDLQRSQGIVQNDMDISAEQVAEWVDSMNDIKSSFNEEMDSIVHTIARHLNKCNTK